TLQQQIDRPPLFVTFDKDFQSRISWIVECPLVDRQPPAGGKAQEGCFLAVIELCGVEVAPRLVDGNLRPNAACPSIVDADTAVSVAPRALFAQHPAVRQYNREPAVIRDSPCFIGRRSRDLRTTIGLAGVL